MKPLDADEWSRVIGQHGLDKYREQLWQFVRTCTRLVPTKATEPLAIGASRFNGIPDVTRGFDWPRAKHKPMVFGAQIDLAALPEESRGTLPKHGLLAFFFERPFAGESTHRCRVEYFRPQDGSLSPATAPSGTTSKTVRSMAFERALSLPAPLDYDFKHFYYVSMTDEDQRRYDQLYELTNPSPSHQLLGHPRRIQGDPRFRFEEESKGISLDTLMTPDERVSFINHADQSRAFALLPGWKEWTLLLQLEYDTSLRWSWGDSGNVQFYVREPNIAKGAFLSARMTQQCS